MNQTMCNNSNVVGGGLRKKIFEEGQYVKYS